MGTVSKSEEAESEMEDRAAAPEWSEEDLDQAVHVGFAGSRGSPPLGSFLPFYKLREAHHRES